MNSAALVLALVTSTATVAAAQPPSTATLLAKITALEQEIVRLKQVGCVGPTAIAPSGSTGQTLAGAAAEAARIAHAWPVSANVVPAYDPAKAAASLATVSPPDAPSAAAPLPPGAGVAAWKGRMRLLVTQLADHRTYLAEAVSREHTLDVQLHSFTPGWDRRQAAVVEDHWREAVTEVGRLTALVKNDTRAIADLELEAHRAGVPPGWLVLE
jgi:hypothetical protein